MQNHYDPPRRSEIVDISSTDHTFTIQTITRLHNATNTAGTVVVRLRGDGTTNSNRYIPAGGVIDGFFAMVVRSGTSLTATGAIVGTSPHSSDS